MVGQLPEHRASIAFGLVWADTPALGMLIFVSRRPC